MFSKLRFLALCFFTNFYMLQGAPVSQESAKSVALNFFSFVSTEGHRGNITATLSFTSNGSDGQVDFYVFNINPGPGFVIVAGEDNIRPILAYSTESNFTADFTRTGVSDWVNNVSANLQTARSIHYNAGARVQKEWQDYMNGNNPNTSKSTVIGPLLHTTWNQEPYYNILCPYNSTENERAVTGCVATAMAQIMKYWAFPAQGASSYSYNDAPPMFSNNYGTQSANFGATTYNWAGMANNVTSNISPADTLSYQCGVAVAMDYGTDDQNGSGAFVLQSEAGQGNPCAQMAYATYFSYNPNTLQGVQASAYDSTAWLNLIESELNAGRVVQYEGDDPTAGGHTWVCDGYESTGLLHMNWGWGGVYDGYFVPSNLDADGYNFNENEAALIGIEPVYPITASVTVDNPVLCSGESATLTATGPALATYSWSPVTGVNCSTCASTSVSPTETTLYTVTIDSLGVTARASITVIIAKPVTANFAFSSTSGCTMPQAVTFNSTSLNSTNYLWNFGDGTTDTTSDVIHSYNQFGSFTITLVAYNACYYDTVVKTNEIQVVDKAPVSIDHNICSGQSISLSAADTFGTIYWYTAPAGGTSFTSGSSYITPTLNATTTYYLEASIPANPGNAGAPDSSIGMGNFYTRTTQRGMVFNSLELQTLNSVVVYSDSAGSRTISVVDSNGNTVNGNTVTLHIADGRQTVPLNFSMPVENNLSLVLSGFNYLHRNLTGASYPYTSTDGNLVITGNTSNSSAAYYYFYNWTLQPYPCVTSRTVVPVFVLDMGGVSFSASGTFSAVAFAPADTNATSYTWDFGDGATSSVINPVHSYSAGGNYTVQLVVSNGSCADTVEQQINTATLGINDILSVEGVSVYPNPAKEDLTVMISSDQPADNCKLIIRDILGQAISQNVIGLDEGMNTFHLNTSALAPGVYLLNLQEGAQITTRRFVKQN